jgi:hypothetical protein
MKKHVLIDEKHVSFMKKHVLISEKHVSFMKKHVLISEKHVSLTVGYWQKLCINDRRVPREPLRALTRINYEL